MIYERNLAAGQRITVSPQPCGATAVTIHAGNACITIQLDAETRPWLIRALTVADQDAFLTHIYPYRREGSR